MLKSLLQLLPFTATWWARITCLSAYPICIKTKIIISKLKLSTELYRWMRSMSTDLINAGRAKRKGSGNLTLFAEKTSRLSHLVIDFIHFWPMITRWIVLVVCPYRKYRVRHTYWLNIDSFFDDSRTECTLIMCSTQHRWYLALRIVWRYNKTPCE